MSSNKKKIQENDRTGLGPISRREFAVSSMAILGTCAGADAAAKAAPQPIIQTGDAPSRTIATPVSEAAQTIRITVNNWKYELKVEPEWILRDVLRDQLGFLSIKDMCNGLAAATPSAVSMVTPSHSAASIMQEKSQVASFINFYLTYVDEEIGDVGYFPANPEALEAAKQAWLDAMGQ